MAGMPCTFIRLAGCPLNCSYCDTRQAIPFDSGEQRDIDDVLESIAAKRTPLVLVTGGEPLAQKNCLKLLSKLTALYDYVQLETSGAYDISEVPKEVSIILDIKAPGSGESKRNRWQNMQHLQPNTEIKFVLTSKSDYDWAKKIMLQYELANKCTILMSCTWGDLEPRDLAEWIVADQLPVRLQLQLHKYIWGSEVTGV